MKIKVGNDIICVRRIEKLYNKYGQKFLDKIFTQNEIDYCESKKKNKFQSYAARFAGKEATFKAISSCLSNKFEISWKDIEILKNADGSPCVSIKNLECELDISLSHERDYAIAMVVAVIK